MNVTKVQLLLGFAKFTVKDPKFGYEGSFHNPWVFDVTVGESLHYEIATLVQGELGSINTAVRELKTEYDILDAHKTDWNDKTEKRDPITVADAGELQEVLTRVKEGKIPVTNEFGKPVYEGYLKEKVDFLTPRVAYIPKAYIEGTTYVRSRTLENLVSRESDNPPLPRV